MRAPVPLPSVVLKPCLLTPTSEWSVYLLLLSIFSLAYQFYFHLPSYFLLYADIAYRRYGDFRWCNLPTKVFLLSSVKTGVRDDHLNLVKKWAGLRLNFNFRETIYPWFTPIAPMCILIENLQVTLHLHPWKTVEIQLCPSEGPSPAFRALSPWRWKIWQISWGRSWPCIWGDPFFLGSLCVLSTMGLWKISFCLLEAFSGPELSKCHVEKIGCIFKATCVLICHSSTIWPLKALLVSLSSIRGLPSGQSLILGQNPKLANVLGEGRETAGEPHLVSLQ